MGLVDPGEVVDPEDVYHDLLAGRGLDPALLREEVGEHPLCAEDLVAAAEGFDLREGGVEAACADRHRVREIEYPRLRGITRDCFGEALVGER